MELIVAFSIMLILSTIALPLARVKVHREKERQLRQALAEMRKAIDRYKDMADAGQLGQIDPDTFGYPPSLEILVEGVPVQQGAMGSGMSGTGQPGFGTPASQLGGRGRSGSSFGGGGIGGSSFGNRPGSSMSGGRGGSAFGGGMGGASPGSFGGRQGGGGFGSRSGQGIGSGSGSFGSQGMGSGDSERKIRFLRKIPLDPMTNSTDWGVRSVEDDPNSFSWGGGNVFDVFTKSMDVALDGTRYSEW